MALWKYRPTGDGRGVVDVFDGERGDFRQIRFRRWLLEESPPHHRVQRDLEKLVAVGIPQAAALQLMGAPAGAPASDEIRRERHQAGIRTAVAQFDVQQATWFTVTQAAELLGLDAGSVSRLADNRKLTDNGLKGQDRRIQPASAAAYAMRSRKSTGSCDVAPETDGELRCQPPESAMHRFFDDAGLTAFALELFAERNAHPDE